MKHFLVVSHGSRSPKTKQEMTALVAKLKEKVRSGQVSYAFLEIESPSIPQAVDNSVKEGAAEIVLVLNFLNPGRHVDEDVPRIVQEAQKKYPKVSFRITQPVGQHSKIVDLFLDMM
ncbi:MAG: hypothetical protein A2Z88_05500 [Omnitrophica WOR_2 bacterium GWA2_47_8]|nr:MAG: hypothetical protein A2Z88_05500 [Omnitrophica WOR_2 bacterium GWA2_47_8]